MAGSGKSTVDFGSFPGGGQATLDVTGQSGLVSTSLVEAWLLPFATSDHVIDEHIAEKENMDVIANYKVDGTFTIVATPKTIPQRQPRIFTGSREDSSQRSVLYGQFTIGWVWA